MNDSNSNKNKFYENCDKEKPRTHLIFRTNIMSSIEQLETLRNAELYDDCKTLVMSTDIFPIAYIHVLGRIHLNTR